jgi:hypothetical protein
MTRVLVVGGYGTFGVRVAERLARDPHLEIVIAGRSERQAKLAADTLAQSAAAKLGYASLDVTAPDKTLILGVAPDILINASGPFQHQSYALARACIEARVHYIDLADARRFVNGITALDEAAKEAGVLAVSGASSVPALAAAVVDDLAPRFRSLESIVYGISPGDRFEPGPATTASILNALGKPFPITFAGAPKTAYGWQGLNCHRFPEIGMRLFGYCEVPDLDLFPIRYPELKTVCFYAGVETALFHLSLWLLSWPCRYRLIRRPERLARSLLWLKRRMSWLGSDRGGMFMTLEGVGVEGRRKQVNWHLIARSGHGPYVPAIASVIVANKLARQQLGLRGAMACLGLFTLDEFLAEVADLDISTIAD